MLVELHHNMCGDWFKASRTTPTFISLVLFCIKSTVTVTNMVLNGVLCYESNWSEIGSMKKITSIFG